MPNQLARRVGELISEGRLHMSPFPAVATELVALLSRQDFDLSDIAKLVSRDEVLTVKILRYANSAMFVGKRDIQSIKDAVLRIGADSLFNLAVAMTLGQEAGRPGPLVDVRFRIWRRASFAAEVARRLAEHKGIPKEQAFLCTFLATIGQTATVCAIEEIIAKIPTTNRRTVNEWMAECAPWEQRLTRRLVEEWHLPEVVSSVLLADLESCSDDSRAFLELISLCYRVAHLLDEHGTDFATHLDGIPGLSEETRMELVPILASVPTSVWALSPEEGTNGVDAGHVVRPSKTLGDDLSAVEFVATHICSARSSVYRCVAICEAGIVLVGAGPMSQGFLAKIQLDFKEDSLTFVGQVTACAEQDGEYNIEIRSYGLAGNEQKIWLDLLDEVCGKSTAKIRALTAEALKAKEVAVERVRESVAKMETTKKKGSPTTPRKKRFPWPFRS